MVSCPCLKLKPLLHVETFSWNLCATALRNMFQQALHVTGSVSWNFLNIRCETSFTTSRTAFYFCNGCNDRSGDKNESSTVQHHFVKLVCNAVAHMFQLKVSTSNSGLTVLLPSDFALKSVFYCFSIHYLYTIKQVYYTVIKHSEHLRTLVKCRKHSAAARVFNTRRVLSRNTRLRLLYVLNK